jgi:OOP family OmpA-OmpF porin
MKKSMSNRLLRAGFTAILGVSLSCWAQAPTAASAPVTEAPNTSTSAGPVVVSGVVPDEATRQAILTKVREVYGSGRVVDRLGVAASSAPPNWGNNVKKLITTDLKNVRRGHLRISGSEVELVGEADSAATRDKIAAHLSASLNPTYLVNNRLSLAEAPQARIDSVLDGKIVEFESSSAVLTPLGRQVLDELIDVLNSLDGKKIQVIGHTDASGLRQSNVALSRLRAAAVKSYLSANGIPAAGIFTVGMGPDQPLVSNDTPEGRAKNRRIEFKVMP